MSNESSILSKLAYNETFSCVQCGYCLPSCPTYVAFGKETHSPRGRINLVKLAAEGKVQLSEIANSIDLCLGCRACETACPTNVEYGKIYNSAVDVLSELNVNKTGFVEKKLRKFLLQKILPNKMSLQILRNGLYVYQKTKVNTFMRKTNLINVLPASLNELENVTPNIAVKKKKEEIISTKSIKKIKIGFFPGCIMETVFKDINDKAIKLLEYAGCEVITIRDQGCCGALQQHAGEKKTAIQLAKNNIKAYESYEVDYIVNAIGGCGASMVEYPLYFSSNDHWRKRAELFSDKVKDVSLILHEVGLKYNKEINMKVIYQPSCHLTNVQKVVDEPYELMMKIPGISYIEMKNKDLCCGSAGIYNIEHYDESMKILENKVEQLKEIRPHIVVTTNPGCHLQMKIGVKKAGLEADRVRVVHLVELLYEACITD